MVILLSSQKWPKEKSYMKMFEIKESITIYDNGKHGQDFVSFSGIVQYVYGDYKYKNKYIIENDDKQVIYADCYKQDIKGTIDKGTKVLVKGFVAGICDYYSISEIVLIFHANEIIEEISHENCTLSSSIEIQGTEKTSHTEETV